MQGKKKNTVGILHSGYLFGVKLAGKSFNFSFRSHAYSLNVSTYSFCYLKGEEHNKRQIPELVPQIGLD